MDNKVLGLIIIVFGGLVLFSELEAAIWVSAISVGVGTGIYFFWKDENKNAICIAAYINGIRLIDNIIL